MALDDRNKLNRIEELKNKLYSKNYHGEVHRHDHVGEYGDFNVPDSWGDDTKLSLPDKIFMKTSLFKKIFTYSVIFFILAIGYASYTFFIGGNTVSNNNIDINITGNSFVAGGEELSLQVSITNRNASDLLLVDLVLAYPKSAASSSQGDLEYLRQSLGSIPAGSIRAENFKITLFGEQASVHNVKATIEYRVDGSNAIFVKEQPYEVTITSTPIDLSIEAPDEASSDQEINLNVKAALNATKPASKVLVKVNYPLGFQFIKATPAPAFGNNVWNLGDLSPGTIRNISITGKMTGVVDGEDKIFQASLGTQSTNDKSQIGVVFNATSHLIAIKQASIQAILAINNVVSREYGIDTKSKISGEIKWDNNLSSSIKDVEIRAKLSGNALDRKTVGASLGFYNSAQDTIIWDKNYNSSFSEIGPNSSGAVSFSLSPVSLLNSSSGISDPVINIEVSIKGKRSEGGFTTENLINSSTYVVRIISDVGLATKALYYSGAFSNSGPIPPKAETITTYTIVWSVSNTTNNISKAMVRATLPPWVDFGSSISPANADLSYNALTKEIIWNLGSIPKGTGVNTPSKEVSFQVKLSPSLSQVGQAPVLINDAILTGHDDFANVDIRVNKSSLNTRLSNDSSFPSGGDRVVE